MVEIYNLKKISLSRKEVFDSAVPAGNPGDHSLEGVLLFIENGEETEVPIDASFATISKPNTAIVSADKMNVVYRGVENPLTISIPGVP